jgi:voltage-gated potassium channel
LKQRSQEPRGKTPHIACCALDGYGLREADIKRRTGVIIVAVKRADGRLEFPPSGDEILEAGDSVVVLGCRDKLDQFRQQFLES